MVRSLFQTKRKVHRTGGGGEESGKCHISSSPVWVPHIARGEKSGIKVEKRDKGSEYYKVSSMAMLKVGLTV